MLEFVAEGRDAACAVEEDLCDVCRVGQLWHELFGQNRKHGIFAISYRIDAGGVIFKDAMLAGVESPVCFGRTAVCYEYAVLHDVLCLSSWLLSLPWALLLWQERQRREPDRWLKAGSFRACCWG